LDLGVRFLSKGGFAVMTFFTKKILQDLKEREEELSSGKCLQTNSIADITSRLGAGREDTRKSAAAAVA
jgi:hypothetical protein